MQSDAAFGSLKCFAQNAIWKRTLQTHGSSSHTMNAVVSIFDTANGRFIVRKFQKKTQTAHRCVKSLYLDAQHLLNCEHPNISQGVTYCTLHLSKLRNSLWSQRSMPLDKSRIQGFGGGPPTEESWWSDLETKFSKFWDHCCHLKCDEKKGNVYNCLYTLLCIVYGVVLFIFGGRAKAAEDLLQRSQYSAAVGDRCV